MRLDHLLSKENCVGQTRGSAIGEGTEVVVQFPGTKEREKGNRGGVAQLGEHLPCKQGVMGSNPIISTNGKVRRRSETAGSL